MRPLLRICYLLIILLSPPCATHAGHKKHVPRAQAAPRIYDCFLFFNELEVLDIRLHELYDFVDYFVLVECCQTFRGDPKPFYFENNKARFAPFMDKIIHIKVNDIYNTETPWIREAHQRNDISRGLKNCKSNDIIFISDVDEIFRKELIPTVKAYFSDPLFNGPILGFIMPMYAYYLNRPFDLAWKGTLAARASYLKEHTPQTLRDFSHHTHIHPGACNYIEDGGWHFSWLGGRDAWVTKWLAYSHGSDEIPGIYNDGTLDEGPFCAFDDSYPKYIRDKEAYYRQIGFIHE